MKHPSRTTLAAACSLSLAYGGLVAQEEPAPEPVPADPPPAESVDSLPEPESEPVTPVLEPPSDASEPALPEAALPDDPILPAGESALPVAPADGSDPEADEGAERTGATELVLKDGRILKDFQIHSWNKTSLTIFHSTGAANVPAHLLPESVVQSYRMDPKLSLEQEQANRVKRTERAVANLQAMDERRALRRMAPVTVQGSVVTVGGEGVVLQIEDPQDIASKGYQRIGGMIYDKNGKPVPQYRGQIFGSVWVTGHPLQDAVVDGDLLRFQGRVSGRQQIEGKTYPSIRYEKGAP